MDNNPNVNNLIILGMFLHRILLLEIQFEEVYCGQLFEHLRKHSALELQGLSYLSRYSYWTLKSQMVKKNDFSRNSCYLDFDS